MAGGRYMMQGLIAGSEAVAGAITQNKERAKLRKQLEKVGRAIDPEGTVDWASMGLEEIQGELEARTLKQAQAITKSRMDEATRRGRYYDSQRKSMESSRTMREDEAARTASQRAADTQYMMRAGIESQAPRLLNNQAYGRYRADNQNPNFAPIARYAAQTGRLPGPEMQSYLQPPPPPLKPAVHDLGGGSRGVSYGNQFQQIAKDRENPPQMARMIEWLMANQGMDFDQAMATYIKMSQREDPIMQFLRGGQTMGQPRSPLPGGGRAETPKSVADRLLGVQD